MVPLYLSLSDHCIKMLQAIDLDVSCISCWSRLHRRLDVTFHYAPFFPLPPPSSQAQQQFPTTVMYDSAPFLCRLEVLHPRLHQTRTTLLPPQASRHMTLQRAPASRHMTPQRLLVARPMMQLLMQPTSCPGWCLATPARPRALPSLSPTPQLPRHRQVSHGSRCGALHALVILLSEQRAEETLVSTRHPQAETRAGGVGAGGGGGGHYQA